MTQLLKQITDKGNGCVNGKLNINANVANAHCEAESMSLFPLCSLPKEYDSKGFIKLKEARSQKYIISVIILILIKNVFT